LIDAHLRSAILSCQSRRAYGTLGQWLLPR
jgi:hypothetical protein